MTSDRAVLHTYLTEKPASDPTDPSTLRVPPMAGFAQFVIYKDKNLQNKQAESGFLPVDDYINRDGEWLRTNYNFRWTVTGLEPDTQYYYLVETKSSDGSHSRTSSNVNSFRTAPTKDDSNDVGKVHFGVVYLVEGSTPNIKVRETDQIQGKLMLKEEITPDNVARIPNS